jgi:hypothetical protein
MYQVGDATEPLANDPYFDTEAEAITAARRLATGNRVYAIWRYTGDTDNPETLYLVYQGDLWRS